MPDDARPIAVVDIDGVVADVRHRLHHIERGRKNWKAFFAAAAADPAHPEGLAVVHTLAAEHRVVYLTGRPERLRAVTEQWLDHHGIGGHPVLMRRGNDHRPAVQMKLEQLAELATGAVIEIVVDDDRRVLDAVRAAGYPAFAAEWERRTPDAAAALAAAQEGDGVT